MLYRVFEKGGCFSIRAVLATHYTRCTIRLNWMIKKRQQRRADTEPVKRTARKKSLELGVPDFACNTGDGGGVGTA